MKIHQKTALMAKWGAGLALLVACCGGGSVSAATQVRDLLGPDKELRSHFNQAEFDRNFIHHADTVGEGADGVKLHYVRGGSGKEVVVLLHGYPATWYDYRYVLPVLAKNYTVLAFDLRGMGDSSKTRGGYNPSTMANDVYQVVTKLGFKQAKVVGHDIGAPVAFMYAVQHPDAVSKLVELEFVAGAALDELEKKAYPNLWFFAFQAVPDLPEKLTEGRERTYLSLFLNPYTYGGSTIPPDAVDEHVRCYSAPGGMRAGFETYRAFPKDIKDNTESIKTKLTMPVLALGGDQSAGPFIVAMLQEMAVNVRGGALPNTGHFVAEEHPELLTQRLLAFWDEVRANKPVAP